MHGCAFTERTAEHTGTTAVGRALSLWVAVPGFVFHACGICPGRVRLLSWC